MAEQEIWKDIPGYEGVYQVSNCGRIKTLPFWHNNRVSGYWTEEKIRKQALNASGYYKVTLAKGGNYKTFLVHRLVAVAFVNNPNNLPEVNHINEDKQDNRVDNLEWCSGEYNKTFGTMQIRAKESKYKAVEQLTLEGDFIKKWSSAKEAGITLGFAPTNITRCCKGKIKSLHGYKWKYAEGD